MQGARLRSKVFETRLYASIKFFLFTLFGSAFMLLGFLALYFESGNHGERTFDITQLTELGAAGAFAGGVRRLGLRGDVPGFRGQGPDVATPHLAPRRPHRRPHRGVGLAGGDHAEARLLRLHPDLPPDPPRGGSDWAPG